MNEVEDCTFKPQLVSHNQSRNQDYEEDEMAEQNYELEESDIKITAYHNHQLPNHKEEIINLLNQESNVNRSNSRSK